MKYIILFYLFSLSLFTYSQEEDPLKLLAYSNAHQVDVYMTRHDWHKVKKHELDTIDGAYELYKKKTFGHGNMYMAIHVGKFCHYQVFWSKHQDYSAVLTYEDFLLVPTGKSKFNTVIENDKYHLKTVSLEDYHDDKNQNLFFGIIHKDNHPDAVTSDEIFDLHKSAGIEDHHFEKTEKDVAKDLEEEERRRKELEEKEKEISEKDKAEDLRLREIERQKELEKKYGPKENEEQ